MIDALSHNFSKPALDAACEIFLSIPQRTTTNTVRRLPTYNHWLSIIEGCCRHNHSTKAFEYIRWMKTGSGAPWKMDNTLPHSTTAPPQEEERENVNAATPCLIKPRITDKDKTDYVKNPYLLCLTLLSRTDANFRINRRLLTDVEDVEDDVTTACCSTVKESVYKLYQELEGATTEVLMEDGKVDSEQTEERVDVVRQQWNAIVHAATFYTPTT